MADPKTVYKSESWGGDGHVLLEVRLELDREITKNDEKAISRHCEEMLKDLHVESVLLNPDNLKDKVEWLRAAEGVFAQAGLAPIFMEEIPNEYCGPRCCPHLPWLIVTSSIGYVKIGWRKRVLSLDWSRSVVKATAEELFKEESVTMSGQSIHAWGYAKATAYLKELNAQAHGAKRSPPP